MSPIENDSHPLRESPKKAGRFPVANSCPLNKPLRPAIYFPKGLTLEGWGVFFRFLVLRSLLPLRNRFIKESALHVHRLQKFLALWQPQGFFFYSLRKQGKRDGERCILDVRLMQKKEAPLTTLTCCILTCIDCEFAYELEICALNTPVVTNYIPHHGCIKF